jgi:hypothetical protein
MEGLAQYMSLSEYTYIVHISFRITYTVNFCPKPFVFLQYMLFKNDLAYESLSLSDIVLSFHSWS